jgi:predicted ester cyclase
MIAEDDRVVCRNRWEATNSTTGRRIEFHGFVEWRFEGDRIAERWAAVTAPEEIQS